MTDLVKFSYNGTGIRGDDERKMLNLTDMWRADGEAPSRKPADWARKEGRRYINFLREKLNMPGGHNEVIRTVRGGVDPCTWAIDKVALAYAMYLSVEFQDQSLSIISAVYRDGGYTVPGREREYMAKLESKVRELSLMQWVTSEQISHLTLMLEQQKSGLFGPEGKEELCKLIREVAGKRKLLGDPHATSGAVQKEIRQAIGFSDARGSSWDLCNVEAAHVAKRIVKGMLKVLDRRIKKAGKSAPSKQTTIFEFAAKAKSSN